MKILHITNNYPSPEFPIFGIFVKEQIDSLSALGLENEVFFINGRGNGKYEYLKAILKIRKHLNKNKYDLIHCHHSYSALTLLCSGKIYGRKCLLSYQNDPGREGGKNLFKVLYHFFDLIILKNKSPEQRYSKVVYQPNGVNIKLFIPRAKAECKRQLGLEEDRRYIITMDSNNFKRKQKRIDRFNEIIKILKEQYSLKDIEPLILTNTDRHLIPTYICASNLHLLTSDFEGSPNSVKECLACNVPVVSTPVGNVAELVNGINGCYVSKSFNPEELAELSVKAIEKNSFLSRELLIARGMDISTVANRLLEIYETVLGKTLSND